MGASRKMHAMGGDAPAALRMIPANLPGKLHKPGLDIKERALVARGRAVMLGKAPRPRCAAPPVAEPPDLRGDCPSSVQNCCKSQPRVFQSRFSVNDRRGHASLS